MPSGPHKFEHDIIDQMMMYEDTLIFDPYARDFHAKHCPLHGEKSQKQNHQSDGPPEYGVQFGGGNGKYLAPGEKCCQPQLKTFNCYNQRSYLNQPIKLPFDMNQINTT